MTKHQVPEIFGRYAPTSVFNSLQREIDRVFSDFGRGFSLPAEFGKAAASLQLNVAETDKEIEVTADVPGVDAKDINVELRDDVLTIKGEKNVEKEERKKDYHLVERSFGSFERSIMLPTDVDASKVAAHFDKGVLKITLPKLPGKQENTKKIEVKAA